MAAFTSATAKTSFSRMIATLALARKLPLRITCLGEARYLDDDSLSSVYCAPRRARLGECDSLDNAITAIERLVREDRIDIHDDSAVAFSLRLFIVEDNEHCLVLAGEPGQHGVTWCDPVASDGEARRVVDAASKLRGEAFRQATSDNHSVARTLRFRASVLEGRLVHPDWRQAARTALLKVGSDAAKCAA